MTGEEEAHIFDVNGASQGSIYRSGTTIAHFVRFGTDMIIPFKTSMEIKRFDFTPPAYAETNTYNFGHYGTWGGYIKDTVSLHHSDV